MRPVTLPPELAPHPRFGPGPGRRGDSPEPHDPEVQLVWWARADAARVVAGTGLPAAVPGVTHWFDHLCLCRRCGAPFLFFGEEQRWWYETLALPVDVQCVDCAGCRRTVRALDALRQSWDAWVVTPPTDPGEQLRFALATIELVAEDRIGLRQLDRARHVAKRLAGSPDGQALRDAIAEVPARRSAERERRREVARAAIAWRRR